MATVIDSFILEYIFRMDRASLDRIQSGTDKLKKGLDDAANSVNTLARGLGIAGGAITAVAGAASAAAINWESDFTDVLKTVNGTEAELAALETRIREMATQEIPLSHSELAEMAASAGQLGIQTDKVDEFVEVVAKLAATTNLVEGGSKELARFAAITDMSQDDFDRLGSVVVDLGNNLATTEQEIVNFGLRLAGEGNRIGLSESEILSFGAAASSVGLNAEAGGTAFTRIWSEMDKAIQTGSEELETFAKVAGFTAGQEFAGLFMEEGADDATVRFVQGLARMQAEGENVHEILESLGFQQIRIRDALLRAAGSGDLFTDALALGTNAWEENVALTREAELRFKTTASQLTILRNKVYDVGITVGGVLLPYIQRLTDSVSPMLERFGEWIEQHPTVVAVTTGIGLALLGLAGILFGVATAMRIVAFTATPIVGIFNAIGAVIGFLTSGTLILRAQLFALAVQQRAVAIWAGIVRVALLLWNGAIALTQGATYRLIGATIVQQAQLMALRIQLIGLAIQQRAAAVWSGITAVAMGAWTFATQQLSLSMLALRAQLLGQLVAQRAIAVWSGIVRIATLAWTGVQWLLNAALTANPIGLVIVAIGALIAAIALVIVYWDKISAAVSWAWDKLRSFAEGMPGWLSIVLAIFMPFIGIPLLIIRHWDTIRGFFSWMWDKVVGIFSAAWDKISPIVDGVIGGAKAIGGFLGFGGDDETGGSPPGFTPSPGGAGSPIPATAGGGTGLPALGGGGAAFQGLPGFQTPLPVAQVPAPVGALPGGGGSITRDITVDIGDIIIHAPGADSREIGANVSRQVRDQVQTAIRNVDNEIDR